MGHLSIESREAARRTLNRPGFGLTESLHELRIGVPALADPGTGELVGITDVGARIADVAGVTKHASLQRLPQRVELSAIVEHEAVHQGGDDLSIAFAIGERHELGPVPIKLRESPGLMILGRQGCGKTTALVAIGEAVMNRFSPQQAQLTLIDPVGRCRRRRRGDFGGVSVGARRAVGPDRKIARMATFCLTMSLYGFSDTRAYPPGVADFTSAPHVPLTCWNTWGGVDQFDVGIGADD